MGATRQFIAIASIVGIFSLIGSMMAFVITYHEYARHNLGKGRTFQEAIKTAFFAFVLLGIFTLIVVALLIWAQ